MDSRQAKACATQMQVAVSATRHELATKADLQAEIAALEARLVKWVVGTQLAGTALILSGVAALKLL